MTIDLTVERYHNLLIQGAVLVDDNDLGEDVRVLVYLEHAVQDAHINRDGKRRVVSRRMQYVLIDQEGNKHDAGSAPYLDYRPLAEAEEILVQPLLGSLGTGKEIEAQAFSMRSSIWCHLTCRKFVNGKKSW